MLQLLSNAEVYAPEALGLCHVLVAGGRIVWVGADRPALSSNLGVVESDLTGKRLIPGIIDCHAHLTGGGGEAGPQTRVPPVPLSRFTGAGVTTVVGLLGTDDVTRDIAGLLAATRGLVAQGLTAYCYTGGYHIPPVTLTGSVRGDIVHLDRVIGLGEVAISDHRSSQPVLREILHLASEAHVGGMLSNKAGTLHLHVGDGPRGLSLVRRALDGSEIPPRVFHPTHVNRRKALFEEALVVADRGCTIDVTAFPPTDGADEYTAADALVRFLDTGIPRERITVSSDAGGCLPVFDADGRMAECGVGDSSALASTLQHLICTGHDPDRVLPAFTSNVAKLLRLDSKGRITAGADADLVALDSKGAITDVMAMGRWHVRDGAQAVRGGFEAAR